MRNLRIMALLVLSVASAACASRKCCCGPVGAGFDREAETKAVYAVLLNDLYARDWLNREIEQWVVDPEIPEVIGGGDDMVRDRVKGARPDTLADLERPRPGGRVPVDLAPGRPVRWFTRAEFAALPSVPVGATHRWTAFHERFPRSPGHITLSHIGFSADGTEALVMPGCWFDSLGGARDIVRLQKVGGAWQVRQRSHLVVS